MLQQRTRRKSWLSMIKQCFNELLLKFFFVILFEHMCDEPKKSVMQKKR